MTREILEQLEAHFAGELSLDEFQAWLVARTWDDPNPPTLALEIELLLAEATSGHLTRDELEATLRKLYRARTLIQA